MDANLDLAIDQSDLTDRSYARLREMILARQFHPNQKLSVDRLAEGLGVSRTPVKDALHRLAADGLVTISRRVGSFVTPLTAKDVREIFDLRLLFEVHAADEGIARATDDDLGQMRALLTTMAECIEGEHYRSSDMERFLPADHALHRQIVRLAQNDRMLAMYEALNVHVQIARVYYVRELTNVRQGQAEHERIVAAYEANDLDLLKQTLSDHITTVRDLVLRTVDAVGGVL